MNRAVKAVVILVVAVAVIALLFTVVFPWIDGMRADPTLGVSAGLV